MQICFKLDEGGRITKQKHITNLPFKDVENECRKTQYALILLALNLIHLTFTIFFGSQTNRKNVKNARNKNNFATRFSRMN